MTREREEAIKFLKDYLDEEVYTEKCRNAHKMAIQALEIPQELTDGTNEVLDKIKAKIEALEYLNIEDGSGGHDKYIEQYEVLKIIDKYRMESGE